MEQEARTHSTGGIRRELTLVTAIFLSALPLPVEAQLQIEEIQAHTDATWLYKRYFSNPADRADEVSDTARLFANGFALLIARGEDVTAPIMTFQRMIDEANRTAGFTGNRWPDSGLSPTERQPSEEISLRAGTSDPNQADSRGETRRQARLRIANQYHLPYKFSGEDQWLIVPAERDPIDNILSSEEYLGTPTSRNYVVPAPWLWDLKPSDVIWTDGSSIARVVGHVGIVTYPGHEWGKLRVQPTITDANIEGVRNHVFIEEWSKTYTQMMALTSLLGWDGALSIRQNISGFGWDCIYQYDVIRPCKDEGTTKRLLVARWAASQVGKPYNWNFINPSDTTKFYCTSLIWQAYLSVGINVLFPKIIRANEIIFPRYFVGNWYLHKY